MIKLNNKNITYVALADTNNSVKGVKEIWYADTNNSVKLVYRRKDALIEGEDYEKYHWLKGDDSAYIQGIAFDLWNNHFNARIGKNERLRYFNYYVQSTAANFKIEVDNNVSIPYLLAIFRNANNGVHIDELRPYSAMPDVVDYDFYIDNSTFYCNRDGVIHTNSGTNIAIESNWTSIQPMIKSAKISYIREVLPNDTYRSNLTPCKLLKPVPKWLDANGIRRQVGECGMIDLVSGKFYGNVNSVGTFTVENYYERKEWLVGDGSAFLSTTNGLTGLNSVEWELSGNGQAVLNSFGLTTGAAQFVSDLSYVDGSIGKIGIYDNNRGYFWTTKLDVNTLRLVSGTTINAITINDVDLSNPNYQWNGNFVLQFINRAAGYKVSKVTVNGSVRYVPCTLTMDLPASMDANNIARTKGTSGMWDLVSDKFYGNVANSGTFKAVNLAEGVDYEVHQWLKGDGTAYIDTLVSDLTNVKNIYCKIKKPSDVSAISDTRIFGREPNNTYPGTRLVVNFTGPYKSNITLWTASANVSPAFTTESGFINIDFESNTVSTTNQSSLSIEEYTNFIGIKIHLFHDNGTGNPYKGSIGEFTIGDTMQLIPVRLLRPIPAKYDANGIVRQAGECGMYDTVNDKFYGNVASGGTFSVSDDS